MRVLVVDNYDSFVYNIAQRLGELKVEPTVVRNDKITINSVKSIDPDAIVISPGPGSPSRQEVLWHMHGYYSKVGTTNTHPWSLPRTSRNSSRIRRESNQCQKS